MSSMQHDGASPATNDTTASGKSTPDAIPDLSSSEHEKVQARTAISAVVVHESVREEGIRELKRSLYPH